MTAYGTDSLSKSSFSVLQWWHLTPLEKFKLNDDCGGYKKHCQHRRLQLTDGFFSRWFFGQINRREAEEYLMAHTNARGTFLVRESEQNPGGFALSIKDWDQERSYHVKHYKIKPLDNNRWIILWTTRHSDSQGDRNWPKFILFVKQKIMKDQEWLAFWITNFPINAK